MMFDKAVCESCGSDKGYRVKEMPIVKTFGETTHIYPGFKAYCKNCGHQMSVMEVENANVTSLEKVIRDETDRIFPLSAEELDVLANYHSRLDNIAWLETKTTPIRLIHLQGTATINDNKILFYQLSEKDGLFLVNGHHMPVYMMFAAQKNMDSYGKTWRVWKDYPSTKLKEEAFWEDEQL